MICVGIDPGKGGAVALVSPCRLTYYLASVSYVDGSGYLPKQMSAILRELAPDLCVLENQIAMPKQGRSSILTNGRGWGLWEGIIAALGIPLLPVRAQEWQKSVLRGVSGEGKERAVRAAENLLPLLSLPKSKANKSAVADAACLAIYGLRTSNAQQ